MPVLIALLHDIVITLGIYSLTQREMTTSTIAAVLTILGYSIYDGIVVFDKVDENTRLVSSSGGLSYGGMINVSLNQALMRSLNTTITALLPVGSLLVVGSWILGASVLESGLSFAGVFAVNALYLPLVEEPGLRKRFGADYDAYRANVARWLPRLSPWEP